MTLGIVCDLDGVLYLHDEPVPGARAALEAFAGAGARVVFATNNSTRTPAAVARVITERVGHPVRADDVVTAAVATARHLEGGPSRAMVVGMEGLVSALAEVGVAVESENPEVVVVGLDRELTYRKLAAATLELARGVRFVATGLDATFPTPRGPLPGTGAIVAALAAATGRTPEVCGKPHPPMRRLVRERLGAVEEVWVVGDRPETDLAMARAEGWRAALVLTGVTRDPAAVPDEWRPDLVVASIAELPERLGIRISP